MNVIKVDEDLSLIELRYSSAGEIFDAIIKNRPHLRRWLPFVDLTKKQSDTEQFIKSVKQSRATKPDLIYEVRLKKEFAGLIALKEVDYLQRKTEIGYWLAKEYEGKGIITRSSAALLDFCFGELELNRVQIKAATGNVQSLLVPERLGFKFEGIEREGEYLNGKYVDLMVYSILKSEWEGTAGSGF
jgi:ribosomal-protein-serine acetyltransferase